MKETTTPEPRTWCYLFDDRFVPKIEDGSKVQTIRKKGAVTPKPGDIAQLEQWQGVAFRKGSRRRVIKREVIKTVGEITVEKDRTIIGPFHTCYNSALNGFAERDGFQSWDDLVDYFESKGWLPFSGILVTWA